MKNSILNILCLAGLLTACSGSDDRLPVVEEGYAAVRFTASQAVGRQTKADPGTDGLTANGHVAVYAWQGKTPYGGGKICLFELVHVPSGKQYVQPRPA